LRDRDLEIAPTSERALKRGLVVYLVSGYQIKHYGHALGQRMRTDEIDARLISRFLAREIDRRGTRMMGDPRSRLKPRTA
jgi:transposase